MALEWWHDYGMAHPRLIHVISASSHHSSPLILIPDWQDWPLNEVWMREWRWNDGHFRIKVNPLDFFWGSSRPIRGLDFELSTNRKPRFGQFLSVISISITAILSSFRHSLVIHLIPASFHHWLLASYQNLIPDSFMHHSIIPGSFHHPWIIPVILSVKSVHPTPSAEGVGWTDF